MTVRSNLSGIRRLLPCLIWILFCNSGSSWPTLSLRQGFVETYFSKKGSRSFVESRVALHAAKNKRKKTSGGGGGGGGFGQTTVKQKAPTKKQILKRVEEVYGGTSPEHIARSTQEKIQMKIREQPAPIQMALQLYQQLQQWESHIGQLTVLQQAQLEPAAIEGANRARQELDRLYKEHSPVISCDQDLHNLLQKYTWDASADAKVARSMIGDMNSATEECIQHACRLVADAITFEDGCEDAESRLCLDVGCGFGVLVPFFVKAGIPSANIHGVDLSSEMIRNAREQHPTCTFTACDFLNDYETPTLFHAIVFCSSLHDLPDVADALTKATSLLTDGGRMVIVHPQGASHVQQQQRSNPVLVKRGLPDTKELQALPNLKLTVEPSFEAGTEYLAVLEKVESQGDNI